MAFDYAASGLPENPHWRAAADRYQEWLEKNMSQFGDKGIASFMKNQPVAAALQVIAHCRNWSEETVTVVLLGQAKYGLLSSSAAEDQARAVFGDRAVALAKVTAGQAAPADAEMERDAGRVYMVESLSAMRDQIIGRKRVDRHHSVRWNMLEGFEKGFAALKGQDPGLDALFAESLQKSRAALEALGPAPASAPRAAPPAPPPFDYAASGLADKELWRNAAQSAVYWAQQHMPEEKIASWMETHAVAAAKMLSGNCAGVSDESVCVLLLGPAAAWVAQADDRQSEVFRELYGARAVALVRALAGKEAAPDADMERDMRRIRQVSAIGAMKNPKTDRDALRGFYASFRGGAPGLDALFDAAEAARAAPRKNAPPRP